MTKIKDINQRLIKEYKIKLHNAIEYKISIRNAIKALRLIKEVQPNISIFDDVNPSEELCMLGKKLTLAKNKTSLYTHIIQCLKGNTPIYKKINKTHKDTCDIFRTIKYSEPKYILDNKGYITKIIGENKNSFFTEMYDFKWYSTIITIEFINKGIILPKINLDEDSYIFDSLELAKKNQNPKLLKKIDKIENKYLRKKQKLERKLIELEEKKEKKLKNV
jgi:hypothetical protein